MIGSTNYTINPDIVDDHMILKLALLFSVFFFGAIIQFVTNLVQIGLPYTVVVFMLGMLIGLTGDQKIEVGPHLMLNIFMPILIFEGAFAMDVFVLRKVFLQALFMAGPGLVVITGMTAAVAQPLMGSATWGWKESLLFGSILSATDPVAVVALLKELGASPFLSLFIEGESLLNDGTAMVAFNVLYQVITGAKELTASFVIVDGFLKFAIGGPLFGYFMSRSCLLWLNNTFNDPSSEISATFVAAFLTFFISETFLHASGVLALVVLGVVLSNNRTSISPEVETFLHSFWEMLAYLANTVIFFLVGMIVVPLISDYNTNPWEFVYIFLIYISVNSIRALVIIICSPLLKRMGYQLPWQFIVVASWSGLRGAVGLALALMVYETSEDKIPTDTVSYRVFLHLCGIVFLTLVINATTISKVLALLGMSDISQARRAAMATALSVLADIKHKTMCVWMTDRFLSDVDWSLVDVLCSLKEPWDLTQDEDEEKKLRVWAVCPHCEEDVPYQPTTKEMQDMRNEAILRLLKAQRLSYWRQFEHGMLSVVAVRMLTELTEMAADVKGQFLDTEVIKDTWKTTTLTKLVEWVRKQDVARTEGGYHMALAAQFLKHDDASDRWWILKKRPHSLKELLTSRWFVITVDIILFFMMDSLVSLTHVILSQQKQNTHYQQSNIFASTSSIVCGLMVLYAIVRLVVLKRLYLYTIWFWLSCFIFISGIVNLVLELVFHRSTDNEVQNQVVIFIQLSLWILRQVHTLEILVPVLIMLLENQEVQRLSDGYDMGRGYVMGEEEIRSRIDHMAERKNIIEELRNHCDAAKMDILKCLGLLQKDNPEVAMGVKTRQAIRSVLNNVRDEIHALLQDGLLEETEGTDLAGMVESKMKQLLTAPPKVPLPSTEKILHNVPWIADNDNLVRFIQSHAKLENYEYGDIIMRQDEPTTGVSIILSGLVKLELSIPLASDTPDGEPKYTTRVLDFLTAGNVLGELGVLTGKPRSATVKCETGVQLLAISIEDIQHAFIKFAYLEPPLKYRLWRLSAIRICTGIFLDQPSFQGMTKEKLRVRLENGYVEEIDNTPSTFPIFFHVGELVLLHGVALDGFTSEKYTGPCYIPQQAQLLCFETKQKPNPALFILPTENCPGIIRPSASLHEAQPTIEELKSSHHYGQSGTVNLPQCSTPNAVGPAISGKAGGGFKRTVLTHILEMGDRKPSMRRGSMHPGALISSKPLLMSKKVMKICRSASMSQQLSAQQSGIKCMSMTDNVNRMQLESKLTKLTERMQLNTKDYSLSYSSHITEKSSDSIDKLTMSKSDHKFHTSKGLLKPNVSNSMPDVVIHTSKSQAQSSKRHKLIPFDQINAAPDTDDSHDGKEGHSLEHGRETKHSKHDKRYDHEHDRHAKDREKHGKEHDKDRQGKGHDHDRHGRNHEHGHRKRSKHDKGRDKGLQNNERHKDGKGNWSKQGKGQEQSQGTIGARNITPRNSQSPTHVYESGSRSQPSSISITGRRSNKVNPMDFYTAPPEKQGVDWWQAGGRSLPSQSGEYSAAQQDVAAGSFESLQVDKHPLKGGISTHPDKGGKYHPMYRSSKPDEMPGTSSRSPLPSTPIIKQRINPVQSLKHSETQLMNLPQPSDPSLEVVYTTKAASSYLEPPSSTDSRQMTSSQETLPLLILDRSFREEDEDEDEAYDCTLDDIIYKKRLSAIDEKLSADMMETASKRSNVSAYSSCYRKDLNIQDPDKPAGSSRVLKVMEGETSSIPVDCKTRGSSAGGHGKGLKSGKHAHAANTVVGRQVDHQITHVAILDKDKQPEQHTQDIQSDQERKPDQDREKHPERYSDQDRETPHERDRDQDRKPDQDRETNHEGNPDQYRHPDQNKKPDQHSTCIQQEEHTKQDPDRKPKTGGENTNPNNHHISDRQREADDVDLSALDQQSREQASGKPHCEGDPGGIANVHQLPRGFPPSKSVPLDMTPVGIPQQENIRPFSQQEEIHPALLLQRVVEVKEERPGTKVSTPRTVISAGAALPRPHSSTKSDTVTWLETQKENSGTQTLRKDLRKLAPGQLTDNGTQTGQDEVSPGDQTTITSGAGPPAREK